MTSGAGLEQTDRAKHRHQWVSREGISFGVRIGYTHCYVCGRIIRTWPVADTSASYQVTWISA